MQIIVYWSALRPGFREPPANGEEVWIVGGASADPEVCQISRQNPCNSGQKRRPMFLTWKICAQRFWLQKIAPTVWRKTREDLFADHTKERSSRFLWVRICSQNFEQKTFWASLRKFRQKSFSPPKIGPLLRLCPLLPSIGLVYSTFIDQRSHVEKLFLLKIWL